MDYPLARRGQTSLLFSGTPTNRVLTRPMRSFVVLSITSGLVLLALGISLGCLPWTSVAGKNKGPRGSNLGQFRGTLQPQMDGAYGRLPLSFELNMGQTDARVKFVTAVEAIHSF